MFGPGGRAPVQVAGLDAGLREVAANSLARWCRRLSGADLGLNMLTAREAAQLRSLCLARGAPGLCEALTGIEAAFVVGGGAHAADALNRFAELLAGAIASNAPSNEGGTVALEPGAVVVAPAIVSDAARAGRRGPVAPPPAMASPPPPVDASRSASSSICEPPLLPLLPPQGADAGAMDKTAPAAASPGAPPYAAAEDAGAKHAAAPDAAAMDVAARDVASRDAAAKEVAAPYAAKDARAKDPAFVRNASASSSGSLFSRSAAPRSGPRGPALLGTIFGFRAFRSGTGEAPPRRMPGPTPDAGDGLLGLRALRDARPDRPPPLLRKASSVPPEWPPRARTPGRRQGRAPRSAPPRAQPPTIPSWAYPVAGGAASLLVATAVVIVRDRWPHVDPVDRTAAEGGAPGVAPAPSSVALPAPAAPSIEASAEHLTQLVHGRGTETNELHALLDTQARLALDCKNDPRACGPGWTSYARNSIERIDPNGLDLSGPAAGPLPAWLQRLKMPSDFPLRDDPLLRSRFDQNTKNIAGRQRLQAELFECAAYEDIFQSTLIKYGAPSWLTAVVYQESACNPRATSPVGARGLWQFMPESARAYGLRVVDGEVDERLNPIKSTDAAVHFLTDLQRKIGAWDLALAAYNMGPFAVLATLAQVKAQAGFWELAHAGLLPQETTDYVPAIEAYALVLQNLNRLEFARDGRRLESTAEVVVKPGTRLSLLARAASTTTVHIRELNPEFLRDVVPAGETTARVPDAEAHRAEAFLQSWSPDDARDTCVPEDFDWGAKPFATSRFAKNCPAMGAAPDAR